jgi:hypothetical protein
VPAIRRKCMKRTRHVSRRVALSLIMVLGPAMRVSAQTVETFPTQNAALAAIKSRYTITIGLEVSAKNPDLSQRPISLHMSNADVPGVLDELVREWPGYMWTLRDGVYDLYPRDSAAGILDEKISSFAILNASPSEASHAIDRLPEVRRWLTEHGVRRRELETGNMSVVGVSRTNASLSLSDVPLRTLLNRLADELPSRQWTVVRYGDSAQYLAIYF